MNVDGLQISVIIPTRQEGLRIGECLDSVLASYYPLDDLEIIVVDAMSDDGTRDIVEAYASKHPQIRLVDNPRLITPIALNIGVKGARGKIVVLLGAHSLIAKDFLLQCVNLLTEHPEVSCVGGVTEAIAETPWERAVKAALGSLLASGSTKHLKKRGYATTVAYGAYRREVFEKFGFFDERFVRAQDYEFNLRLVRAGGLIYQDPQIKSSYHPRTSPSKMFRQYCQYGYWKLQVLVKHRYMSIRNFIPPLYFLALLGSGLGGLLSTASLYALASLAGGYFVVLFLLSLWLKRCTDRKGKVLLIMLALFLIHSGFSVGIFKGIFTVPGMQRRKDEGM